MARIQLATHALLLLTLALGSSCQRWSRLETPPERLVGTYAGEGRIIVSWCEQEHLPLAIEISDEGMSFSIGKRPLKLIII